MGILIEFFSIILSSIFGAILEGLVGAIVGIFSGQ